ncbi:hypothetical protein CAPTEDRAFT_195865 [Capitella teleta]|uniref:Uncharacterized protein n=1 Tax=Capitella teleta TaxID=283909 RepID=R7VHL7_CAPTE|nr:hypothetical protein CAPTEDRAFT_195865 [Capitella teleta]|eukprot:ELU18072.1 hypothetical protein CAPTEDRAFT_195865 [Capitella teleta]
MDNPKPTMLPFSDSFISGLTSTSLASASAHSLLPPTQKSTLKLNIRPTISVQLFKAIEDGNTWKFEYLTNCGASLDSFVSSAGYKVLVKALHIDDSKKRLVMFKKLLDLGADVRDVDNITKRDVLMWSVFLNRSREVSLILESDGAMDIDLQRKDADGNTSLHYAVLHNNSRNLKKLCQLMRKYDLSVDIKDQSGFTPYLHSVREGKDDCAVTLLQYGGANRGIHDSAVHASDHTWRSFGENSRRHQQTSINRKRASIYKYMGRLPELRAANFDSNNVRVIHSQREHEKLGSLYRENTKMRIKNKFQLPPIPSIDLIESIPELRSAPAIKSEKTDLAVSKTSKQDISALLGLYAEQHMTATRKSAPPTREVDLSDDEGDSDLDFNVLCLPKKKRETKVSICSVVSNRRRSCISTSPAPSGRMSSSSTVITTEGGSCVDAI